MSNHELIMNTGNRANSLKAKTEQNIYVTCKSFFVKYSKEVYL